MRLQKKLTLTVNELATDFKIKILTNTRIYLILKKKINKNNMNHEIILIILKANKIKKKKIKLRKYN